jgi:hypothetical protein
MRPPRSICNTLLKNGRHAASPALWLSRCRKVMCVFPCTPKLWKNRVTRSSRLILPSFTISIIATLVATALVSDETSKIVSSDICDTSGSRLRWPKAR